MCASFSTEAGAEFDIGGSACSGLLPSLIGVCHVAVQFPLYEACKAKLAERAGTTVDNLDPLSVVSAQPGICMAQHLAFAPCMTYQARCCVHESALQKGSTFVLAFQAAISVQLTTPALVAH